VARERWSCRAAGRSPAREEASVRPNDSARFPECANRSAALGGCLPSRQAGAWFTARGRDGVHPDAQTPARERRSSWRAEPSQRHRDESANGGRCVLRSPAPVLTRRKTTMTATCGIGILWVACAAHSSCRRHRLCRRQDRGATRRSSDRAASGSRGRRRPGPANPEEQTTR
jgi:hypothetical protein